MKKSRLVLMVDEETHAILKTEAAMTGKDMADVFEELVRTHLTEAAHNVRKRRQREKRQPPKDDA